MATHSVFLPGESHGQKSLVGYSPWITSVGHDLVTKPPSPGGHGFSSKEQESFNFKAAVIIC